MPLGPLQAEPAYAPGLHVALFHLVAKCSEDEIQVSGTQAEGRGPSHDRFSTTPVGAAQT